MNSLTFQKKKITEIEYNMMEPCQVAFGRPDTPPNAGAGAG
jgi:hypothetical protein